jgi:hypothetical protein
MRRQKRRQKMRRRPRKRSEIICRFMVKAKIKKNTIDITNNRVENIIFVFKFSKEQTSFYFDTING